MREVKLIIGDVSIDLTDRLSSLSICCEAGSEWAKNEIDRMLARQSRPDFDELHECLDIIETASLIDGVALDALKNE